MGRECRHEPQPTWQSLLCQAERAVKRVCTAPACVRRWFLRCTTPSCQKPARRGPRCAWVTAASGWLILLAGCALAANPEPPTLWLPVPVKDLTATRVGDEVHLHWTMPKETTDKVLLKGDQRAHFCWINGAVPEKPAVAAKPAGAAQSGTAQQGPVRPAPRPAPAPPSPVLDAKTCKPAGDEMFPPNKPADFTAKMPAELIAGSPRTVTYVVELENDAGKTAGPSNPAWVAAGVAPPGVTGLRLEARAEGVELHWDAAAARAQMVMRIHRTLLSKPGAPQPGAAKPNHGNGVPPPEEQTLEVDLDKSDSGEALDHDAPLDHEWKYWAERVARVKTDGQALEIAGLPSAPMTIDAKDVFPPAVPSGVAAVADAQAKAIDVSWTPDTEADLAGYVVYRRDVTAGTAAERISGTAPVVPPSFADANVVAGHRYAYAVSAVDQDGNESARSGEVEEEIPQ